jgi:hypothetical protein
MDLDKLRNAVVGNVEAHGWHIAGVHADTRNAWPQYAYTVGFEDSLAHPEVIVLGLSHEAAGGLLNAVGARIREKGELAVETRYTDLLENGLELAFVETAEAPARELMRIANWYYEAISPRAGGRYRALQLVWPDPNGVFSWEPGFDARYTELQPLLTNRAASDGGDAPATM